MTWIWLGRGLAVLMSLSVVLGAAASAGAGTGSLTLISTNAAGEKADFGVAEFSASDDGAKVAFASTSTNLVSQPVSGERVFVKDVASGVVTLASAAADGTAANGESYSPSISHNGRYVTFTSSATNLDPRDTDPGVDVYLKDLASGSVTLVSTNASGVKGAGASQGPAPVSDDGRIVAFASRAANFDPRHTSQTCTRVSGGRLITFDCTDGEAYVKDLASGAITLLTTGNHINQSCPNCLPQGVFGPSGGDFLSISADGNKVALSVFDPLTATDADPGPDVFVRDMTTGSTMLASTGLPAGTPDSETGSGAYVPRMSADGTRVAFQGSFSTTSCPGPCIEVFVKDLGSDALIRVSQRADGTGANDVAQDARISGDGRYVGFSSYATNLDPADTDALGDIYMKDLETGELTLVSVSDDGTKGDGHSLLASPASGGESVIFMTQSTNFDPVDTDGAVDDLYLKRFVSPPVDANGDGIIDSLQPAGTTFGSFTDSSLSPPTSGSIVNTSGLTVTITDAPDLVDGVQIAVGSGTGRASFSVCGGFPLRVSAGSTVVITCGSVTVKTLPGSAGSADVVLGNGVSVVTVPQGAVAKISDNGGGLYSVVNLGTIPVSITVDGITGAVGPGTSSPLATWHFVGFTQPVDNVPTMNKLKAGQAVPIKWRLLDSNNAPVTSLATATITVASLSCSLGTTIDQIEETVAGASGLQNLGSGYYQMNWKSPTTYANSCKSLRLNIGDGVTHDAYFQFTK